MDPNETLKRCRELASSAMKQAEEYADTLQAHSDAFGDDATLTPEYQTLGDLSQAFTDLDAWLVRGGFLPADWERKPGFGSWSVIDADRDKERGQAQLGLVAVLFWLALVLVLWSVGR